MYHVSVMFRVHLFDFYGCSEEYIMMKNKKSFILRTLFCPLLYDMTVNEFMHRK